MGLLGEARKAMGEAVKVEPENPQYNFGMGVISSFSQDAKSYAREGDWRREEQANASTP